MDVYIVCSGAPTKTDYPPEWTAHFDDVFAHRVYQHLTNDPELCTGCGAACVSCRNDYDDIDFSQDVVGKLQLPAELLAYVDDPSDHLPAKLPKHEVLLAINIHEDILLVLPDMAKAAGARAFIVPGEDPDWLSKWTRRRLQAHCKEIGLDYAFPKPFCSLQESEAHPVINEFIRHFRIGKPKMDFTVEEGVIKRAEVIRSAPCGDTYFVAHNLEGRSLDEPLVELTAKFWHSYPCVASMKMDYELADTPLHKGGYNHYDALHTALQTLK